MLNDRGRIAHVCRHNLTPWDFDGMKGNRSKLNQSHGMINDMPHYSSLVILLDGGRRVFPQDRPLKMRAMANFWLKWCPFQNEIVKKTN